MADFNEFENDFIDDDFMDDTPPKTAPTDDLMAKLAEFEHKVDDNIKMLQSSKDAKERLKAAKWLGDSGAPKAIPALSISYRNEGDKRVKEAAEYALGQFKALYLAVRPRKGENFGDALSRDNNSHIVKLLEDIAYEGKVGGEPLVSRPRLKLLQILLGIVFVGLVIANITLLVINNSGGDEPNASEPPSNPVLATTTDIRRSLTHLTGVVGTLITQFENVRGGSAFNCELALMMPPGMSVSDTVIEEEPEVQVLFRRLEASVQQVSDSFQLYEMACSEGIELSTEDIAQAQSFLSRADQDISAILQSASELESRLTQEEIERNTTPSATPTLTKTPTPTPTITPTPTPEPTATIDPKLISVHIGGIGFVLDTVNSRTRGANVLLTQYWSDVTQAGTTNGCRNIRPTIPGDYDVEISDELLERFPELGDARDNVNLGLALLRDGWEIFDNACSTGQMATSLEVGSSIASAAAQAFIDAAMLMNMLPQ